MPKALNTQLALLFTTALALLLIVFASVAGAQVSAVSFPIAELGNCGSKAECHAYCDDLANVSACVAFAESNGLMDAKEAKAAKEFSRLGGKGPGGCTSKDACEAFCEDTKNMRQCLAFARQSGLMDTKELEEAEKVASYLEQGGSLPGGCRNGRECKAYCESGEHTDECMQFALSAGFMSEREAELFKKTGGTGPGGCRGSACKTFCDSEANREQCIAFALEHDLMTQEERQMMEEGRAKAMEALEQAPPGVISCIEAALGAGKVSQLRRGEGFAGPQLGEVLPRCMRDIMGDGSRGPFGPGTDATECLRTVFGEDFQEKMQRGELDPGAHDDEIRDCMQAKMGEGFLNDTGRWERPERDEPASDGDTERRMPQPGAAGDRRPSFDDFDGSRRPEGGESGAMRARMDASMRQELEAQLRSGSFDRSKLPSDFAPEGAFPPPESFDRPPEHMQFPPPGTFMHDAPPDGMPLPPPPFEAPAPAPTSMREGYLANALSALLRFLNLR